MATRKAKVKSKIYELYDGPRGVTEYSRWYGKFTKVIYRVRAYSCAQAKYLCNERIRAETASDSGIVKIDD